MAKISKDVLEAVKHLQQGEVIGIPTETVYGLAGNALNEHAILRIFEVKNRPKFDPLIVHVANLDQARDFVLEFPSNALQLADQFWPGPLTLLLDKKPIVPDLLTAGSQRVAIRIPNHPLTLQMLEQLEFPIAAPSANPFGYVSPTTSQHVEDQLGDKISFILDGGPCAVGLESTIIGFEAEKPIIYRLGGIRLEDLESSVGRVKLNLNLSSNPLAPGMLKTHYAPLKKIMVGKIPDLMTKYQHKKIGIISFKEDFKPLNGSTQIILSQRGDLNEAAKNLFSALRIMDQSDIDLIITQRFPEEGLGKAINDRLHRASS
ncbi:MAG: L-threonylcarbamoyladenylate synthase [Cyclobacteriaceae bacterium]